MATRRALLGSAAAVVPALALQPAGRAGVRLSDNGDTVTLTNAAISVTVVKATAQIPELKLIGSRRGHADVNLVSGTNGQGYTTFDYYVGTTRFSKGLSKAVYRVVSQSDKRVEIAMSCSDPAVLPFAVDVHMAVERDTPGLYCFMTFGYPDGMPDGLTIQQLRYAVAAGDPSFTAFVVDDRRGVQHRPTIDEMAQAVTLQDTTYQLPDGRVYSKYQNISDLEGDSHVFLISNEELGLAIVQANKDSFAGGPTKQELTCHDYYNGEILLWHPFTSHYGSPDLEPPRGWAKCYGPFYLHVNEDADVPSMWRDAKRAAERERGRWPYTWINEPLYASGERATVSGRTSEVDSWVVLAPPGADRVYQGIPLDGNDWQYQNLGYVYSGRADHSGRFTIPAVRPGLYNVFVGDAIRRQAHVTSRCDVDLGRLPSPPPPRGDTLWRIGRPDRSAGEFHVPGGDFRASLTWLDYPDEFPDGVDYRVGEPLDRFNFFQPCYRTPGTPLQLQLRGTTQDHSLTTWRIRFDARPYRSGTAFLDIALAASVFGTLRVMLNGAELASFDPLPGPAGDNSSYRLADRAMFRRLLPVVFPATSLVPGENVLALSPVRPPKAPLTRGNTVDDWMEPMGGVMYDSIALRVIR